MKCPGIHPDQTVFPSGDSQTWGLTKREYFAAIAMVVLWAGKHWDFELEHFDMADAMQDAVAMADTLIKELSGDE